MKFLSVAAVAVAVASGVHAWGDKGHQAVGFIAEAFLGPNAKAFVESTLGEKYNYSLGVAATWPDDVKKTPEYAWSAGLHFVNVQDSPFNESCSVEVKRDCGNGKCILTAIANYTERVADPSLSVGAHEEALKFLVHFFGDIGQPMHSESLCVGGNWIPTVCNGTLTSLHGAWDDGILDTHVDTEYKGSTTAYAYSLAQQLRAGAFLPVDFTCSNVFDTARSRLVVQDGSYQDTGSRERASVARLDDPLECPLAWAREANAYVCTMMFDYKMKEDLCKGPYYDKAIKVISSQIANQAWRLALTLNAIFDP